MILVENQFDKIKEIEISSEIKSSFMDYAMSVIVSRALSDVRDGLKPVHRRILYAMNNLGMYSDKPFKKSVTVVGEVLGKYHPHGDTAVYDAMVRMAQDFSFRYMLVDGHGNFGSIDGDGAAAMRYTEARMSKISMEMLRDINKNTVNFHDNFDGSEKEPDVLPARFPNLLVNGTTGIAVGMATNIPPHNLGEVIDGILALAENPDITNLELIDFVKGPDFPTGANILGTSGIRKAYETGNGSVLIRSKYEIEELKNGKKRITISEIPYQVNKSRLIEKIAEIANEKRVDGITDLRDESNRNGMKIIIETRKDVNPEVLMNNLFKYTSLQSTFSINMLSLVNNEPKVLTLKEMLYYYLEHQKEVVIRKTKYDLEKAEARAHILEGLKIALDNIDEIIRIIRSSENENIAVTNLIENFGLSEIQAKAIVDMRLKRLTGLERNKIESEYQELTIVIADYRDILNNDNRVLNIVIEDLLNIKNKFGDQRRTEIIYSGEFNIDDEELIPREDIMITITNKGYVKRISADTYKIQNRGGRGIKGMSTYEEDFVEHMFYTHTHDTILIFTNFGKVYKLRGFNFPEYSRTAKGLPIVNLLNLEENEKLNTIIPIKEIVEDKYLVFVTKNGTVKRTELNLFTNIRTTGIRAINLNIDDELISVKLTDGTKDILIGSSNGKSIRFQEDQIRPMGRTATGVRGIKLEDNENVIGMATASNNEENSEDILVISEYGYGKRTSIEEYRQSNRGGKGVKTINITDKNGMLVALKSVSTDEDIMVITNKGMIIRMSVDQISQTGRATQGVKLINLKGEQFVSTVAVVPHEDEIEEGIEEIVEDLNENTEIEKN